MRILEAFGEPISYGGQESFVMNVLDNMDMTGIRADLLSPYYCDNENIRSRIRERGGEVFALGCRFRPGGLRNDAAGPIRYFLRTHRYDAIHIHSGSNSMLAMLARAAAENGIPQIIVHSHCTGRHGLKHFASKMLTERSLRKYPTVYCSCSEEAGRWRFPDDVCSNSLIVINNGIDIERFRYNEAVRDRMRSELGISDDTVLIGCVGRLTYQKNQGFLLDILHAIGKPGFKLILIGDGEDRAALEVKAAELGLSGNVIFTGAVDNVQDYLQAMDIAAMPSRYEGLAIAVIEAQAAGLEIVASDAIPEAAALTDSVIFLPVNDEEKWAEVIMRRHSRHPDHAEKVAEHGYSVAETAEIVRKLYIAE